MRAKPSPPSLLPLFLLLTLHQVARRGHRHSQQGQQEGGLGEGHGGGELWEGRDGAGVGWGVRRPPPLAPTPSPSSHCLGKTVGPQCGGRAGGERAGWPPTAGLASPPLFFPLGARRGPNCGRVGLLLAGRPRPSKRKTHLESVEGEGRGKGHGVGGGRKGESGSEHEKERGAQKIKGLRSNYFFSAPHRAERLTERGPSVCVCVLC